jgi:hypothetical protein
MARIFMSYRRADSGSAAGRLYDHLASHFGRDQIFIDVDAIKPGVDFVDVLENTLAQCDALIAVIGRQWLTVKDKDGKRRLDDPNDFIRLEVETALKRNIRVIPVLVDGAEMPSTADLPETLANLRRRNALTVSNERFSYDVGMLISTVEEILHAARAHKPAAKASQQPARRPARRYRHDPKHSERGVLSWLQPALAPLGWGEGSDHAGFSEQTQHQTRTAFAPPRQSDGYDNTRQWHRPDHWWAWLLGWRPVVEGELQWRHRLDRRRGKHRLLDAAGELR